MDSREELQSFLSDVYKLIPTFHATTRRISGVKALLYMKRDKAKLDLTCLKDNLNAYIHQLETQVDAVCEEKEQYLKTLQDGIFAQGMCLASASESAEQLLEYGREDQLNGSYEKLMTDFASVISATPNVNIELGCCLKFIPNIDVNVNRSSIGYIRYMDLDPADLKVSCDITKSIVGKAVEAKIIFAKTPSDAALQYLDVCVVDDNIKPIRFSLAKSLQDVLSLNFTPKQSGQHKLCVRLYECHAVNSPYCIHVEEIETEKRNDYDKPKLIGQTVDSFKIPSTCGRQENHQNKDTDIVPSPNCDVNTAQSLETFKPLPPSYGMEMVKTLGFETSNLSSQSSSRKCEKAQSIEMYKPPSPTCEQRVQEDMCTRKERTTTSSPREQRSTLPSKVIFSSTPHSSKNVDPVWQGASKRNNKTNIQSRMINFHLKPSKMQSKAASKPKKHVSCMKTSERLVPNRCQMSDTSTSKSSTISNLNESHKTATRAEVSQWTPKSHKDRTKNSSTNKSIDKGEGITDSVSHFQHDHSRKDNTCAEGCFDINRDNHEHCISTKSNAIVKDYQQGSEETNFYVNSPEEWELVDTDELFKLDVQTISCYEERKQKTARQDSGFCEKESSPVDQLLKSNQGTSQFSNHEVLDDDHQACLSMHKSSEVTESGQVIVNDKKSGPVSEQISTESDKQKMASKSTITVLSDVVKEPNSKFASKRSSSVKIKTDLDDDAKSFAENCKQGNISPAMKCVPDANSMHMHMKLDVAVEDVKTMHNPIEDTTFQDRAVMLDDGSDKAISEDGIRIQDPGDITVENVKMLHNIIDEDTAVQDCVMMLGSVPEVDMRNQDFKSLVESVNLSGNVPGKEIKMENIFEAMTNGHDTETSVAEKSTCNVDELFCDGNQGSPVESASGYELDNVTIYPGSHSQSSRLQCSQEGINLEDSKSSKTKETNSIQIHGGNTAVMNDVNGDWVSSNDVDSNTSHHAVDSSNNKTEPSIHHVRQVEDLFKFVSEFVDETLTKIRQELCDKADSQTILAEVNRSESPECNKTLPSDHMNMVLDFPEEITSENVKALIKVPSEVPTALDRAAMRIESSNKYASQEAIQMPDVHGDITVEDANPLHDNPGEDKDHIVMLGDSSHQAVTSQEDIMMPDVPVDIIVEDVRKLIEIPAEDKDCAAMLGDSSDQAVISQEGIILLDVPSDIIVQDVKMLHDIPNEDIIIHDRAMVLGDSSEKATAQGSIRMPGVHADITAKDAKTLHDEETAVQDYVVMPGDSNDQDVTSQDSFLMPDIHSDIAIENAEKLIEIPSEDNTFQNYPVMLADSCDKDLTSQDSILMPDVLDDITVDDAKTLHEIHSEDSEFQDSAMMQADSSEKATSQKSILMPVVHDDNVVEDTEILDDIHTDDTTVQDVTVLLADCSDKTTSQDGILVPDVSGDITDEDAEKLHDIPDEDITDQDVVVMLDDCSDNAETLMEMPSEDTAFQDVAMPLGDSSDKATSQDCIMMLNVSGASITVQDDNMLGHIQNGNTCMQSLDTVQTTSDAKIVQSNMNTNNSIDDINTMDDVIPEIDYDTNIVQKVVSTSDLQEDLNELVSVHVDVFQDEIRCDVLSIELPKELHVESCSAEKNNITENNPLEHSDRYALTSESASDWSQVSIENIQIASTHDAEEHFEDQADRDASPCNVVSKDIVTFRNNNRDAVMRFSSNLQEDRISGSLKSKVLMANHSFDHYEEGVWPREVEVQSECCNMKGLKKDEVNEVLAGNGGYFQVKNLCEVHQQYDNRVLSPASNFRTGVIKAEQAWKKGNANFEQRSKSPLDLISSKNICDVSPSKKSAVVNAFTGHQKSPCNIVHLNEVKTKGKTSKLSPNNFGSFHSDSSDRLKNMDRTISQRSRSPCNEAKNIAPSLNSNAQQTSSGYMPSQQLIYILPNHSGVLPYIPSSGIMAYPQVMPTMLPYPAAYVPTQMMNPMYYNAMCWPMPPHSSENVNRFNASRDS